MNDVFEINVENPLEKHLRNLLDDSETSDKFPYIGIDRFQLYTNIKSKLNKDYYRDIGSSLAADTDGAAFTRHDLGHVNDVIRRAGQLLGLGSEANSPAYANLRPYEIFVLLVACLIHDAGNIEGRKDHAIKARGILRKVCDNHLDGNEIGVISRIARAHGGKTPEGSLDTIGKLDRRDGVEDITVRPQLLASILRLADELAENSNRSNTRKEDKSRYPNLYCKCISTRIDYKSRWIKLDFTISDDDCKIFEKNEFGTEMYFLDYVLNRIAKTEVERRYCDRFLRGFATYTETRVGIELLKNDIEWHQIHFVLMEDSYPDIDIEKNLSSKLDANEIAERYAKMCDEDA